MRVQFQGVGNLGADPEPGTAKVGDEDKPIVEMRVRFDRPRKRGDVYEDDGGFWCNVTVWNEALGNRARDLLQKGSRIFVTGDLKASQYDDDKGVTREAFTLYADYIAIDVFGVEKVVRRRSSVGDKSAKSEAA